MSYEHDDAYWVGRAHERAAILVWLEKEIAEAGYIPRQTAYAQIRDAITKGEHAPTDSPPKGPDG